MDKVYQVFVSSTFSDLENERKAVSDTLAKSGFIPSGMELFPATDQQQLEFIKRIIDRCDYYVVIIGARYGSLDGDKSFTEKEYEYATSKGIPVLAFLHKSPGKILAEKVDTDPAQIKRLDTFRSRLKASRIVAFWTDINDLRTEVLTAVTNAVNLSPGIGWVRGDQAIDPKVLLDAEKLRIENEQLKNRIAVIESGEIVFPKDFVGPEDRLNFSIIKDRKQISRWGLTIKELFKSIFELLVRQESEREITQAIVQLWAHRKKREGDEADGLEIAERDVKMIRSNLEALGLIQLTGRTREVQFLGQAQHRNYVAWSITEKGRRYMASLLATRRTKVT
jgi:hypothetical protein